MPTGLSQQQWLFIWATDSRIMGHTLGISDGCRQLGEADLGIPQLGLVHFRNRSSTWRHRQDAAFN